MASQENNRNIYEINLNEVIELVNDLECNLPHFEELLNSRVELKLLTKRNGKCEISKNEGGTLHSCVKFSQAPVWKKWICHSEGIH